MLEHERRKENANWKKRLIQDGQLQNTENCFRYKPFEGFFSGLCDHKNFTKFLLIHFLLEVITHLGILSEEILVL